MTLRERLARTPPGYEFTVGRVLSIYLGLMIVLMLAALDQTIVATALPRIVSDVGGISEYSWVFAAYMLTSTITVPLYGRLGDVYGRRPLFLVAIALFLVGSALCGAAQEMTELVLALVWAGHAFAWTSTHVVGAFVAAAVLLAVFAAVERRAAEPILPFEVLRNPIVAGSVGCMAFVGMTMFGLITYVPLFVQGVIGTSATSSGVVLTPLMLGAVTTSLVTGQLIARTGRYRWNVLLGPLVLCAGTVMLWRMDVDTTDRQAAFAMVIAGVGIGSMMQVFVLSVQNAVARARIGSATALTQFSRSIGSTIGVAVMGLIVNAGLPADATLGDGVAIHRLPRGLRDDLAAALKPAFGLAVAVTLVVWVIAAVWVKEVPLRRTVDEVAVAEASAATPPVGAD